MKKYSIDETKIINYIFENDNHYDLDKYIYRTDENLDALKAGLNTIKDAAVGIGQRIGREIVSVPLVKYYCAVAKRILNRDMETKRMSFSIIKEIFKESMFCLKFFSKSNYSHYLMMVSSSAYSWEIVMALVVLYEADRDGKSLGETTSRMKSSTPEDFRSYILDFYDRVKNGNIYLDGKTITEKGMSGRGRRGSGKASKSTGITGADVNRVVNFVTSPMPFGVKTFNDRFNGDYADFGDTLAAASKISGLSDETVEALKKIKETVDTQEIDFDSLPRTKTIDIEDGMNRSIIRFPKNEMADDKGKNITYDKISRKYTVSEKINFSKIMDSDPSFPMKENVLRLKFMFLFTDLFNYDANKEYLLNEIIKKINVIKN
jgi:hypothetical protein